VRASAAAAFDSNRNLVFISGGHNNVNALKDVWRYDILNANWTQISDLSLFFSNGVHSHSMTIFGDLVCPVFFPSSLSILC
jgi:hypothetical protein